MISPWTRDGDQQLRPLVHLQMVLGRHGILSGKRRCHQKFSILHGAWLLTLSRFEKNKMKRTLEVTDQCPLCGLETEDKFHPFFRCNLAKQLWVYMAEKWKIPAMESIRNTRKAWLLNLLCNLSVGSRSMVLMTLWRIWHVHNEVLHDKPPSSD